MIDASVLPLYYLCSLAGLVMVVGGIWLLYRQKIYIDTQSKEVTEIETPVGKFRTNVPALVLFALGFIPLIYPMVQLAGLTQQVIIRGNVKANAHPVLIYAVTDSDSLLQDGEFSIPVPVLKKTADYKVVYVVGNTMAQDTVDLKKARKGEVQLLPKEITLAETARYEGNVSPRPAGF